MNITNGLLYRSKTGARRAALPSTTDFVPPPANPPDSGNGAPWPTRAKVLVAILLVAAVLGTVGVAIGLASGDDSSAERLLRDRVATLTVERDDALDAVSQLDAQLATLREQLKAVQASNDDLTEQAVELKTQISALAEQRDAAKGTADQLEADLATVQQQLATVRQSLADAISERDALAKLFPIKFDASLGNSATAGTYDVVLSQIYCSGFTSCGKAPALADLTITETSNGQLRFKIPLLAEGGLFRADGVFHAVVDSKTAVPACAGTPRTARVAMTVVPGTYEIGDDGVRDVVGLGAVITVEAAAVGSCPAGLAFYSAELTPHA